MRIDNFAIVTVFVMSVVASGGALANHGGAPPHDGGGSTSNEFRFAGYTDETNNTLPDTIDGDEGFIAMHALCQDDFGLAARMCTEEELFYSPDAEAPSASAFIAGATA